MNPTPMLPGYRSPLSLLLRNPIFSMASPHDLGWLLSTAKSCDASAQKTLCEQGQRATAFYVLMDGIYEIERKPGSESHFLGCGQAGGGIIGLEPLLEPNRSGNYAAKVTATGPGRYLTILADDFYALMDRSSAFRQSMQQLLQMRSAAVKAVSTPVTVEAVSAPTIGGPRQPGTIAQFVSLVPGLPLPLLIYLLGQEIVRQFPGDSVVIFRQGGLEPPQLMRVPGLPRLAIASGPPEYLQQLARLFDYVFLDGVSYDAPTLVVSLLSGTPDREREYLPAYVQQPALLQTVVLTEQSRPCGCDLGWVGSNWQPNEIVQTARLRLDLPTLRALSTNWDPATAPLVIGPTMRRSIAAWARAVTQRRTGLALAGGGVWSMQAIHVLRELHRRNVPVDVITASSASSMLSAYYATKGLDGLDLLVEQANSGKLDAMALLTVATSPKVMSLFFEQTLGPQCLELLDLEFYPASTNITQGQGVALVSGPLSKAIAASSSSVPVVAATINQRQRFVDGAFSNNVPVQSLSYFNATLTFAVNTFPVARRPESILPQALQSLFSMGPINRMLDFATAFNTLGSLAGALEGERAQVSWDFSTPIDLTYLTTINFYRTSEMVESAATDEGLNAKIDEFERQWRCLQRRGTTPGEAATVSTLREVGEALSLPR
ncbi:MAG: cyclic nucleotide-binding and patatin-like phospholipase domain-containing protein [Hyalangium sp.]|uniref:cyclic nucleotide-binding and patatin-like phospholipase domain-containing protein n=1 Tax=Hyalangium sp. TaxID=2028555 RepID=UPI00389B0F27